MMEGRKLVTSTEDHEGGAEQKTAIAKGKGSLAEARSVGTKLQFGDAFFVQAKRKACCRTVQAGRGEAEVCVSGKVGIGRKQRAEMRALRQARVNYLFLVWALSKNLHRAGSHGHDGGTSTLPAASMQAGRDPPELPAHCPLLVARFPLPAARCRWEKRVPKRHATPSMISSCHRNTKAAAAYQGPAFSAPESPCVAQSEPRTHKLLSDRFCMQVHVRFFIGSDHAVCSVSYRD
jgi:hypothetical protein